MRIRIGTRGSRLARWQAEWTRDRLAEIHGSDAVEIVVIQTQGDRIPDLSLFEKEGKGFFTKEIEAALLREEIDLAVHSAKDLPTRLDAGLAIGAVPRRAPVEDVLISREGLALADLPEGAVLGTSSLRRQAQALHLRPDLEVRPLRGNVDTRIGKLAAGKFDAILLAAAGIERLGFSRRITEVLPVETFLPAVGQGALALEVRSWDDATLQAILPLMDEETFFAVEAERGVLRELEGGCRAPIGAHAVILDGEVRLDCIVASPDGREILREQDTGECTDARNLGERLARRMLEHGADGILDALKSDERTAE